MVLQMWDILKPGYGIRDTKGVIATQSHLLMFGYLTIKHLIELR